MLDVESWIAARLLTGTIHGIVVIGVVWFLCRRFSAIPPPVQAALWWLASLKLLLVFVPLPAVAVPLWPAPLPPDPLPLPPLSGEAMVHTRASTPADAEASLLLSVTVACWVGGLLVHAVRLWGASRRVRRVVTSATPLSPADAPLVRTIAAAVGLRRCPEVRLSGAVDVPVVAGLLRPVVLLPTTLARADWSMALCHEFVHVRRHDLAIGWVPALAERVFFFHPLARVAAREYVTAREACCDAAAIRALGVSARDYGRMLVRLGVARAEPLPAAGGAPTTLESLRRRLDMLQHSPFHGRSKYAAWLPAGALVMFLVPVDVTARPHPEPPAVAAIAAVPAPPDLPALAASGVPSQSALAALPQPVAQAPRSVEPAAPVRPVAPARPVAPTRPVTPAPAAPVAPALYEVRDALVELQALTVRQRVDNAAEYRKLVEEFNLIAEQNARIARDQEEDVRRTQEAAESLRAQREEIATQIANLRIQQEEVARQVREIAELQRALSEAQQRLAREAERIGDGVKPRD